ncbi:hypothetical protein BIV59_02030 [Bacillus sp. MUM 13]|nr:hypothetical protein BIV59_02030 [Bacillus sp. MUM 13]
MEALKIKIIIAVLYAFSFAYLFMNAVSQLFRVRTHDQRGVFQRNFLFPRHRAIIDESEV